VYVQFCFLFLFFVFFRKWKKRVWCLLEVGPHVKVVHKNWYRPASYSILKHDSARNNITVDNQTYANIAMFTLSDSKPHEILHTLCGNLVLADLEVTGNLQHVHTFFKNATQSSYNLGELVLNENNSDLCQNEIYSL
jgi:hypothetical protein